jgi:hypothetical protein
VPQADELKGAMKALVQTQRQMDSLKTSLADLQQDYLAQAEPTDFGGYLKDKMAAHANK